MKIPLLAIATTLALSAMPLALPVQAASGIQRCTMADGSMAYTDQPCARLGGNSAPIPAALMNRLLSTLRAEQRGGLDVASMPADGAPRPARRSLAAGCARSPGQLEADLRGAFALRDANRIAESVHWVGMGHRQAQQVMTRLEALAARPLRDTHYFGVQLASIGDASAALGNSGGVLQLQFGGTSASVVDFPVQRYAGCFFVSA